MEGTVEKDTISPVKDTKTLSAKDSKTVEVEHCIHNGTSDEIKTKTPEKVANGNTPEKRHSSRKTPDQGVKRKTEEAEVDEIKKVKVAEKTDEDEEDLSPKESSESDEPLKPAKKLDDEDVVSESGTVQEAC